MKKVSEGYAVCCPKCGTLIGVSSVSIENHYCPNKDCRTRYTAWVIDGFVICFETGKDDNANSFNRLDTCKDKLTKLIALQ